MQRHERNIRFQVAAVDEYKALIVDHGIKLGYRNEAVAVPNTLADICGREVTVFRFVGGATLVEALYATYADFQEDLKQKKPDTLERCIASSAVVDGMDCVRLAKCASGLDEKKHLLKVASAFMGENALPLTSHHVKNFTKALKRMHRMVGKAVCVMCQCLNNQTELDQFAESGGMPVLDIVKHVGAGIASVLPLGVMKLAALIYSLLPENDTTTVID